jgi:hypothetical protein
MLTQSEFDPLMRQLEQELEDEDRFDRLVLQEEEMESCVFDSVLPPPRWSSASSPAIRWLQKALNRVSAFGIVEDGIPSVATRRALQKFQAENGFRPTGKLGAKTRALLVELSGIHPPSRTTEPEMEFRVAEGEGPTDGCPIDSPSVIRGFAKYSDDLQSPPPNQQAKLAALATGIISSYSGAPNVAPVTEVMVVGYADDDPARERADPGFLQYVSEKRADTVLENLFCKIHATNQPKLTGIRWSVVGRGARNLAVPGSRTEAQRKCNRRAEVLLLRTAQPPPRLDEQQHLEFAADHGTFLEYYHIALQGTSGQFPTPHAAEKQAREIADKVPPFLLKRLQKKRASTPGCPDPQGDFLPYFKDALQGTASKFASADEAIQKAAEAAEATAFGVLLEVRKLEWKYASLPQPMSPDCEIVRGKVAGPANHVLCRTHDHVIDASAKTVIAHDLDEYKAAFRR